MDTRSDPDGQGHTPGHPPAPNPEQFIPVNPSNPFYDNPPSGTLPRTDLAEIERRNPSGNSSRSQRGRGGGFGGGGRLRGKRDASYYRKTPRYCFPERPDYGPVKFIPAGEGDKPVDKSEPCVDEADEVQMPLASIVTSVKSEAIASESIPGIISIPEEAKQELTMIDAAKLTRLSKKRALDSGGSGQCKLMTVNEQSQLFQVCDPDTVKRLKVTPSKPASAVLNELCAGLQFTYEDVTQRLTEPKFLCRVTYPLGENGKDYVGEGRSKKLAKLNVAETVLREIGVEFSDEDRPSKFKGEIQMMDTNIGSVGTMPLPSQPFLQLPNCTNPSSSVNRFQDFTEDEDTIMSSTDFSQTDLIHNPRPETTSLIGPNVFERLKNIPDIEKNALCALNTLIGPETCEFEDASVSGPSHDRTFVVKLNLKCGMTFEGTGGSKKRAKHHAGVQALITILGPKMYENLLLAQGRTPSIAPINVLAANPTEEMPQVPAGFFNEDSINASEYDITFSDYIARIVNDKYEEVMGEHQDFISQKVLAGIVMTRCYPLLENGEVISVSTGTKCVEGDFLSTDGLTVNDCHAEVLATRCLRDFLYSEIENICCATSDAEREESILIEMKSESGDVFYSVKEGVKFHLYISTSPCGDARIFSPKGLETDEEKEGKDELEDSHPSKKNRGVLRAKVEAGEGTIPVDNLISGPQTFDSIVQGNALYTMSCSDKVCRWNVVGVQGALLSNLITPVYYSSITLGSLHHPVHFRRAVLGRIQGLAGQVPLPFKINRAHLLMISHQEKRVVKKSPNHAICWATGWSTPEILAASKGRCEPGGVASRLAKRMAFIRFLTLFRNQTGQRAGFADLSYKEAKLLAEDYQKSNQLFRAHMKEANLGSWISKPVEIDSFYILK